MAVILNFGDLGCLNESAAGSLGAGMASFVRAGFPAVRGFVVTPIVFTEFLKRPEISDAMGMLSSSAETPGEGWRALKSLFHRTRLAWNHEMDLLAAFGELGSAVSISVSAPHGGASHPVYASSGEDLLHGVKHCWLRWLKANAGPLADAKLPAIVVRSVVEAEVSVELRKRGKDIRARSVFGLPEGLVDPSVSADIHEFSLDGSLERMENRSQSFQYAAKAAGPAKVEVAPGFRDEEKMTGEMLSALAPILEHMRSNLGVDMCEVCFVSSRPIICLASLDSARADVQELPPRAQSVNLLKPEAKIKSSGPPAPVVAAGMFLCTDDFSKADAVADEYLEGVMLVGDALAGDGWKEGARYAAEESRRRFRASAIIFELGDLGKGKLERLAEAVKAAASDGMQAGVLIPGIRSAEELSKVVGNIKASLADIQPRPQIWVRVMYPSNLFFMESLAEQSDVLVMDLDTLGRLMLGATDDGSWLPFSIPALEKALEQPLRSKKGKVAVMSADLVSTPGLLEFLVRNGTDIICVTPREVSTVRHIVASVEKRILLERGA